MNCVICGSPAVIYKNMCVSCAAESIRLKAPGKIEVSVCRKCGSIRTGKRWIRSDVERAMTDYILSLIKLNDESFELSLNGMEKANDILHLNLQASLNGITVKHFSLDIPIREKMESCTLCDRKSGSYYEAILQLRFEDNHNIEPYEGIIRELSSIRSEDPDDFISKIVRSEAGFDIYAGTRRLVEKMIKFLSDTYAGSRKVSKKLAGKDEGHDLYRYTYLFRIFNYKLGTIMSVDNRTCCLVRIGSGSMTVEQDDGYRENISIPELSRRGFKIIQSHPEIRRCQIVSRDNDIATVMDMDSFATFEIKDRSGSNEILISRWKDNDFVIG